MKLNTGSGRTRLITVTVVAVLALVGAIGWGTTGQAEEVGPEVGLRAPGFSLQTVEGQDISLADLEGTPTVLYFWATWCGFCQADMPRLDERFRDLTGADPAAGPLIKPDDGFALLAVNLQENHDRVASYATDRGFAYPIVMDPNSEATSQYLVRGTPTYYFIDADGVIRAMHLGPPGNEAMQRLLAEIDVESSS